MNIVKEAIHLMRKSGTHITRRVEKYIYEELADDLFPYAYGDGSADAVESSISYLLSEIESGRLDLRGTYEDRLARRYESLKEEHLALLVELNKRSIGPETDIPPDDLPF